MVVSSYSTLETVATVRNVWKFLRITEESTREPDVSLEPSEGRKPVRTNALTTTLVLQVGKFPN